VPQLAVEGYENLKPEKSKLGKEKLNESKQQGLEYLSCEENLGEAVKIIGFIIHGL
jgi:hypothetical protein